MSNVYEFQGLNDPRKTEATNSKTEESDSENRYNSKDMTSVDYCMKKSQKKHKKKHKKKLNRKIEKLIKKCNKLSKSNKHLEKKIHKIENAEYINKLNGLANSKDEAERKKLLNEIIKILEDNK